MKRRATPPVLLAGVLAAGCFARQYRSNPRIAVVNGDPVVQMAPAARFPAVSEPRLVPAREHEDLPDEYERVVGLAIGSPPRAYPIGLLDRFEVVNDSIPGLSFVVTRCALTGLAAIYDRRVREQTLFFENSGALWRDTLVLRDRETGTLWSAGTGEALVGPLTGEKLDAVPAVVTRTENWSRVHPDSLYLDLAKPTSVPLVIRLYGLSPWQGVSGEETRDRRYRPKQEMFALAQESHALAFTAEEIRKKGHAVTTVGGRRVTIEWDTRLETPHAFVADGRSPERELPLVSMYWFALGRHFDSVATLFGRQRRSAAIEAGSP